MMNGIAALAGLELHDTTIDVLRLDFDRKEIEITVLEDGDPEKPIVLHFTGISALALGEMIEGEEPEIYSVDFTRLPSGLYKASFMTLLGFSRPSWEFSFEFADGSARRIR